MFINPFGPDFYLRAGKLSKEKISYADVLRAAIIAIVLVLIFIYS